MLLFFLISDLVSDDNNTSKLVIFFSTDGGQWNPRFHLLSPN